MKKWIVWVVTVLSLSGCAAEPVYETIGNVWEESQTTAAQGIIDFALPDGAQMQTMAEDSNVKSYSVGEWEIWTQIFPGADIQSTLQQVTGLNMDSLNTVASNVHEMACTQVAWTTTTEEGVQVARTAVFDDGNYHYCISISVPEVDAGEAGEFFSQILSSVTITDTAA